MERAFAHIESVDFAASLGLLNDVYSLAGFIRQDSEVQSLVSSSQAELDAGMCIGDRIGALLNTKTDVAYIHRYDRAIAVYLLVLNRSSSTALRHALCRVYEASMRVTNLRWAFAVYNGLLETLSRDSTQVDEMPAGEAGESSVERYEVKPIQWTESENETTTLYPKDMR